MGANFLVVSPDAARMLARMEEAKPGNETQASAWPKPGERSTPDPGPDQGARNRKSLHAVRHHSAYPITRTMIGLGLWFVVLAEAGLAVSVTTPDAWPVYVALIAIFVTLAIGNGVLAILDMADLAIRNHQRAEDNG